MSGMFDPKTGRSQIFLDEMSRLNGDFVAWMTASLSDEPAAILTRCLAEYQRHVRGLFDAERRLAMTSEERGRFDKQERALLGEVGEMPTTLSRRNIVNSVGLSRAEAGDETFGGIESCKDIAETQKAPTALHFPSFAAQLQAVFTERGSLYTKSIAKHTPYFVAPPAPHLTPMTVEEEEDDCTDQGHAVIDEEGSFYTKSCKLFVKKDRDLGYEDRGIATLYLKPVPNTPHTQLIVRAASSLGTVLVNTLMSHDVAVDRGSDDSVLVVCVPLPGWSRKTILIRVREGAAELESRLKECC